MQLGSRPGVGIVVRNKLKGPRPMLNRRNLIKWLHWLSLGIIIYFFLIEPEGVRQMGAAALATHAGMGVILGLITALWVVLFLRKGLASRPGPKLPGWAKPLHGLGHRALYILLPFMVFTGAATGFAAPYVIQAFGLFPISPGLDAPAIHSAMEELHEITFNVLLIAIVAHAAFHLWRHYGLRDNALRIMMPKPLHRFL